MRSHKKASRKLCVAEILRLFRDFGIATGFWFPRSAWEPTSRRSASLQVVRCAVSLPLLPGATSAQVLRLSMLLHTAATQSV